MVEEKLAWPGWRAYFDSARSTLNPYNRGHESYVYGTLPLFLAKGAGKLLGKTGYDGTYLVGRALSGIFDLLSVWATYLLARRFAGRRSALVAAALLAFAPLGIQLSHFWGSDTFLTSFSVLTVLGAARIALGKRDAVGAAATGVALGLAVACKITALALLGPIGLAALIGAWRHLAAPSRYRPPGRVIAAAALQLLLVGLAAAVTVRIALPYAFLGPSPLSFRLDPRWIADLKRLSALTHSVAGFPPMLQWAGRTILFPLRNFVLWGAGPFFGLAAFGGVLFGLWQVARWRLFDLAPLLFHAVFLFAYHGLSLTKTIRYFYPAYPVLAVLAALAASAAAERARQRTGPARVLRYLPLVLAAGTVLCGLAFSSIYRRPHPRIAASRWIYENVPPPARFANEHWDDPVPLRQPDRDSAPYGGPSLPLYNPDSARKVSELVTELQKADWVAITSNRLYASITRVPDVFPMSTAYYRALFDGRLGFERVAEFTSYPSLGPLVIPDDAAEETFTVYDHPRVLLFRKTPEFSPQRARSILSSAMREEPPIMNVWETWPRAKRRVSAPIVPSRQPELAARAPRPELAMGSAAAALVFYLALLLVAALAWPAAYALFPRFADRGAGLARLLGLLFSTYLLVLAVQMGWIAKGRPAAFLSLGVVGAVSLAILLGRRREMAAFLRNRGRLVLGGEIAFASGFLLFTLIRAFNPEIYWGEKPMDFSILNILVRTSTLPASDPWLAGVPLGYYTFGQEMVAWLSLWTGLSTRYTFNLAFGLLGGLIAQGAFALGRNWAGRTAAGVAAAFFVGVFGNLSGLRLWLIDHRPLDWHYFWATSRVVEHTINEYPFWSLIFADLHAHVLAVPLMLLVLACALHLVRSERAGGFLVSAALLGFAAATQALTNAWDVPLLAGLLLLVFVIAALREGRPSARSAALAALGFPVALAAAALTAAPLWVRRGGAPAIDWNREPGALGRDVLTVFGLFFLLAFGWWLAAALRRLSATGFGPVKLWVAGTLLAGLFVVIGLLSPEMLCAAGILLFLVALLHMAGTAEERLACAIAATGFFLILFTQRVFIWDRMNTFFKLYYETWILLAVATAVLVFRPESEGSLRRWVWPARAAFLLLAIASLFTTVTAARGAIDRFSSPSAQERPVSGGKMRRHVPPGGPTLDGLRYLRRLRPGEYRAVLWLRTAVPGTPVVLEAQGPSYQDFGRISMLTGMPTVLGWDYHVKQRGNPEPEIEARKEAIRHIYSAGTAKEVEGLLRRYHVGYVYVGWLEKKTYPTSGLRKFAETPELFRLVYENPEVRIYRVAGGETQDVLLPRREGLPAPPGGRVEEVEEPPDIRQTAEPDRPPFSGMNQPRDAAVDARERIWIADFGNSRLRVFDKDGGFLGGWGGRGSGPHGFNELCAVAIRGEDLYVADTWNGRVQAYALSGEFRTSAIGLYGPRGIAVDGRGRVWVTDSGNHRIVVYDPELVQIHVFGKRGAAPGEFSGPVGIAAGPGGLIYVADTGNRRIQVLDSGGIVRAVWPVPGWGDGVEPHVEADGSGTVWVSDPARNAVFEFDRDGKLRRRHDVDGAGAGFVRPTGLALDEKTRILYVVNSGNNTVSRLSVPEGKKR
jgi:YYY domain-containing protein